MECSVVSIELPEMLKSIGYAAFKGCNFKKIVIPESVEKIDEYAVGYQNYDTQIEKFYIIGKIGTAAEKYASDNNLIFPRVLPPSGRLRYPFLW